MTESRLKTYVIVAPDGLVYVGLHLNEKEAWTVYLGWPHDSEITAKINNGYYAAEATLTWKKP